MNCEPSYLMQEARCFRCIPHGMQREVSIDLLCRWAKSGGTPTPTTCSSTVVDNWVTSVVNNGGAVPSAQTQRALCDFVNGLDADGLTAKMIAVNAFVPDSIEAATVPIIDLVNPGFPWNNIGLDTFKTADLGLSGLTNDGTKGLDTGVLPTNFFDISSGGLTLYCTDEGPINLLSDFASIQMEDPQWSFQLLVAYSSVTTYFDCFDGSTTRISAPTRNNGRGYFSGNRTSATLTRVYHASELFAHQMLAENAVDQTDGLPSGQPIGVFCWDVDGAFGAYNTKTFSFAAIHFGLTDAESIQFFDRVQQLRIDLGGGWV